MIYKSSLTATTGVAFRTMKEQDVDYIMQQSKRYKELQAIRDIAIYCRDELKARQCRIESLEIQKELYQKYDIII